MNNTRNFEIDGKYKAFNLDMYKLCINNYIFNHRISLAKFETLIAEQVSLVPDTIHKWRMGISAPSSIDIIYKLKEIFGLSSVNILLLDVNVNKKCKYTQMQLNSLERIRKEIVKYLNHKDYKYVDLHSVVLEEYFILKGLEIYQSIIDFLTDEIFPKYELDNGKENSTLILETIAKLADVTKEI